MVLSIRENEAGSSEVRSGSACNNPENLLSSRPVNRPVAFLYESRWILDDNSDKVANHKVPMRSMSSFTIEYPLKLFLKRRVISGPFSSSNRLNSPMFDVLKTLAIFSATRA